MREGRGVACRRMDDGVACRARDGGAKGGGRVVGGGMAWEARDRGGARKVEWCGVEGKGEGRRRL